MKTEIEQRLANLRQQREELVANLHAVSGAITVLEDLLKPQPAPTEKAPDGATTTKGGQ